MLGLRGGWIFLTITNMCLQIFVADKMPNNGKLMVKVLPDVEFGGEEWRSLYPFAIVAGLVYGIGFMTLY